MEEIKVGKVGYVPYIGHFTPYIQNTKTNTSNTVIQTKEFTKEEKCIAGTFAIILYITLVLFVIYMIREFYKHSK